MKDKDKGGQWAFKGCTSYKILAKCQGCRLLEFLFLLIETAVNFQGRIKSLLKKARRIFPSLRSFTEIGIYYEQDEYEYLCPGSMSTMHIVKRSAVVCLAILEEEFPFAVH